MVDLKPREKKDAKESGEPCTASNLTDETRNNPSLENNGWTELKHIFK